MRSGAIPFKFDVSDLLAWARRHASNRLVGATVTLNLPFVSIGVAPKDHERRVARELVIRLRDRRVLSAWECCDNCINDALASLHEIRKFLVDKQVELSDLSEEPLFQLINAMRLGISQFLTFEQRLKQSEDASRYLRPPDVRQAYFDALEELRGHLSRCLGHIAVLAGMEAPSEGLVANYRGRGSLKPTSFACRAIPYHKTLPRAAPGRPAGGLSSARDLAREGSAARLARPCGKVSHQ